MPRCFALRKLWICLVAVSALLPAAGVRDEPGQASPGRGDYLSPLCVALSPDGEQLYVTEHTANQLAVVTVRRGKVAAEVKVPAGPCGVVASPDGSRIYVACAEAGEVAVLDSAAQKVAAKVKVGAYPWGLALSDDGRTLYVCNRFTHDVSVVDTAAAQETARIPAVREPGFCALSEETSTLVVGNMLPYGSNHDTTLASEVTFIDLDSQQPGASLRLPTGCIEVMQVCCSPDGQWAYVVHLLSRFLVPPTQIQRGWINTNALSVINVPNRELLATVLLDDLDLGAANPFGVVMSPDGEQLYVSHAGSHEIQIIDVEGLHRIIEETPAEERPDLANDLTFLYRNHVKQRLQAGGLGPRGIVLSPDGRKLFAANYFSDTVSVLDARTGKVASTIELGPPPKMDRARRGELLFDDATMCFQHWQSCASCHPDGRSDAVMWDLLNDGMGNPKNTKSLLLSGDTPPVMASGVRPDMETAVRTGFRFILFREPEKADVEAVSVYLNSLKPDRSPLLDASDDVRKSIKRGRVLFEDEEPTGCITCHPPPLYTDLKMADVGTRSQFDRRDDFDTPTLIELFRTGPYLHDGTAVTLQDVLTTRNAGDKHGRTSGLSEQEINDLAAFLASL